MRYAAETFGFERELMGRWENWTTRGGAGGPVRLVKGQIVIVDDTVDHDTPGRREPLRTTGQQLWDFSLCVALKSRRNLITAVLDLPSHLREI